MSDNKPKKNTTNEKHHYHGHRERLKNRFMKKPSCVADYELLEIILGYVIPRKDVKPLAKEILEKSNTFMNLLNFDFSDIKGVGAQTKIFFTAIRELFDRCEKQIVKSSKVLTSPSAVNAFFKYSVALEKKENFVVILLNSQNSLIHYEILAQGSVNSAIVYPREVAELALKYNASNAIIVHNHPSGDTEPSNSDIRITKKIAEALKTLDIDLLDHVILSNKDFTSLKQLGIIKDDF